MELLLVRLLLLAVSSSPAAGSGLRIASWNLHQAQNPQRLLAEFAENRLERETDVLALQETVSADGRNLAEELARRRGWSALSLGSNAIVCRSPIERRGSIEANPAWPRALPWAEIRMLDGRAVRIYSVHLSFKFGGNPFIARARAVEARRIARDARRFDGPVVLAGDFNSVGYLLWGHAREPGLRILRSAGYADALERVGGRTQRLLGRLDWIFAAGLQSAAAEAGAFAGSDHRWLWADLRATASGPPAVAQAGFSNRFEPPVWLVGALLCSLALCRRYRRAGQDGGKPRPLARGAAAARRP